MIESGVILCNSYGDQLGLNSNGEIFMAYHECNYPIYRSCVGFELKEGRASCLRCGTLYDDSSMMADIKADESGNQTTIASLFNNDQDVRLYARNISSVSTVDSEYIDESGNLIWKNRVESWKDKKKRKKK